MKHIISNLNRVFENRIRLGAMSLLMVNDWVDFNTLKDNLGVTDGNLASHLSTLEKNEYIEVQKQFVGKKPKTTYRATINGRKAFKEHLDALEKLIRPTE
ncbi:MAG: winged helix-turn-helix domain-containing protein [Flammeovirgaceae bacterium]